MKSSGRLTHIDEVILGSKQENIDFRTFFTVTSQHGLYWNEVILE